MEINALTMLPPMYLTIFACVLGVILSAILSIDNYHKNIEKKFKETFNITDKYFTINTMKKTLETLEKYKNTHMRKKLYKNLNEEQEN